MRAHHTKEKGDLGVLHAKVDLFEKGFILLMPQTEHAPFDLVAYRDERFYRVQVKYRAAVDGQIRFTLASCWADRHGVHTVPIDKHSIDVICIYCPDTRACYYVDPHSVKKCISLRVSAPRNGQVKYVKRAENFTDIPATVLGVPAGSTGDLRTSTTSGTVRDGRTAVTRP